MSHLNPVHFVFLYDACLRALHNEKMLDMHADKQLNLKVAPTDVRHDVLEPVIALLRKRGNGDGSGRGGDGADVVVEAVLVTTP